MANQLLYGFTSLKDLAGRRVTDIGVNVVSDAITQSVEEHNRQMASMLSLFAERTTAYSEKFNSPTVARLQGLDENGRARPIRFAGQYGVAYPIQDGGAAWGMTYKAREKMTVQEANDATATLISADVRWMRDHILAALFTNVPWTFRADDTDDLTIQGLANNDSVKYMVQQGADQGTTDNHYLAQAAGIADATNPFPTIYSELTEHPENGGEVVAFIPTNLKSTTEALAEFHPIADPNLRPGANSDVLVGQLGVPLPGRLLGYTDSKVWVVEWKSLPDSYIIGMTTEGSRPLKMREEPEPSLQGFRLVAQRDDHPFYESQWLRTAGFGAFNRVGGLAYRVGDASYAIPTNYGSPMP